MQAVFCQGCDPKAETLPHSQPNRVAWYNKPVAARSIIRTPFASACKVSMSAIRPLIPLLIAAGILLMLAAPTGELRFVTVRID